MRTTTYWDRVNSNRAKTLKRTSKHNVKEKKRMALKAKQLLKQMKLSSESKLESGKEFESGVEIMDMAGML